MKLSTLISGLKPLSTEGNLNIEIEGIAYDSKKVFKNFIFVCMKGKTTDGCLYIKEAIQRGAVAIVTERPDLSEKATIIQVKSARVVLPILSSKFYNSPTNMLKLIGITGTNGKTTTTYLVKSILECWNKKVGLIGTIAVEIGGKKFHSVRTTPESLDLQKLYRDMLTAGADYCVMEVSSHSIAYNRVGATRFHIGGFTNLTQDHLDFHITMDNYRNAKKNLFYLTDHANIINIDDKEGQRIINDIKYIKVPLLTYGIKEKAHIMAKNIMLEDSGIKFDLVTPEYSIAIEGNIPGEYNVYNCLLAAAIAYAEKVDKKAICQGIKNIPFVPGRMEILKVNTPYKIIIDYAHTPDGLKNVLKSIRAFAKGDVITVFGCGGDRDKAKRPLMGKIAGKFSDFSILTSDNPRTEDPYLIISQIEKGIKETSQNYICIVNRKEAIKKALELAKPSDIVILAGKGHERYQELANTKIDFDERAIVRKLLRE